MLRLPVISEDDYAEVLKLKHRQDYEEQRKERIFNARQRLIGIDKEAIEKQRYDNNKRRLFEKECDRRYDAQWKQIQHAIYGEQIRLKNIARAREDELLEFRREQQQFEQRREFDINDPTKMKRTPPLRQADDDTSFGLASMQVFEGEDLSGTQRRKRQRDQLNAWLSQQVKERKQADDMRQEADEKLRHSLAARNKKLEELVDSERSIRGKMEQKLLDYNYKMVKERRFERERIKIEEQQDNQAEIYNMMTSDMLTENPDVAQSRTDPHKKIAFMYRGMNPDEMAKFREEQAKMVKDRAKLRDLKRLRDDQFQEHILNMDQALVTRQVDHEKEVHDLLMDNVRTNLEMAKVERTRRELEKEIFRNKIGDDFFEQFNKTSR